MAEHQTPVDDHLEPPEQPENRGKRSGVWALPLLAVAGGGAAAMCSQRSEPCPVAVRSQAPAQEVGAQCDRLEPWQVHLSSHHLQPNERPGHTQRVTFDTQDKSTEPQRG